MTAILRLPGVVGLTAIPLLPGGRRSALARDLLRSSSHNRRFGPSRKITFAGFTAAARQITGKVERHPSRSYGLRQRHSGGWQPLDSAYTVASATPGFLRNHRLFNRTASLSPPS